MIPHRIQNADDRKPRYGSWTVYAAVAAALGLAMTQTVQAETREAPQTQAQSTQTAPLPGMQQQAQIPEEDIKTFADATVEVKRIDDAYAPRLEAAASPEEQAQVQNEAMAEMVRAVEEKGLTVEQYNTISQVAQLNPDVARQIYQYMDQAR